MKTLVIGLDCAAPEILLRDERLRNVRRLMQAGCYGRLESVVPPITVPAWMSMATSQDPGSLGIYGFRNRRDHSYGALSFANSTSITAPAIWDYLGGEGRKVVLVGVPPMYPPRKVNGVSIGCFLTPDPARNEFTHPARVKGELERLVGEYPVDVKGFRTDDKEWLRAQIYEMTRKHFEVIRYLMSHEPWDYFQFVEIGLDRMHHGFWKFHDPTHRQHVPGNPYRSVVTDYYAYLDEEIGRTLALLDGDTIVLVASDHGAQGLDGGFAVNEWLHREGLLALRERPSTPTPFSVDRVDWAKTKVWSEGGYYARAHAHPRVPPGGHLPFGPERRARSHRVLRRPAVALDRRDRLRPPPRAGERHGSGRVQPRAVWSVRAVGARPAGTGRGRGHAHPRRRPDAHGPAGPSRPRDHAGRVPAAAPLALQWARISVSTLPSTLPGAWTPRSWYSVGAMSARLAGAP